jgi:hypothetical protein
MLGLDYTPLLPYVKMNGRKHCVVADLASQA